MAMSKNEVMALVYQFLKDCKKKHDVKRAYLFGSFVKGTDREYSDIDVALVTGSLRRSDDALNDEEFEIFHEAQQYDSRLEVVSFTEDDFNQETSGLIKKIKQEGIPAYEFQAPSS
jgi:uncharacterized protein